MASQFIDGQHRNAHLAERHLRSLQRENPEAEVSIAARRNASGEFSERGHFFTFEIKARAIIEDLDQFFTEFDNAEEYETQEYESSADYHTE